MMGNLSTVRQRTKEGMKQCIRFQSLKNHAVTLFEVGKLGDEAADNFVEELENVCVPVRTMYTSEISG